MPGRLINSSDSSLATGHQFLSAEERPVPAIRKNAREQQDLQNGRNVYGGRRDGDLPGKDGKSHAGNGADMASSRRLEERQGHQLAHSPTSYQLPGQPLKPPAMFRPQSAMAFSSSSSSAYNQVKAMYPPRPPSSLGVSWGPSPGISGNISNMRYNESDPMLPLHQRSHSHGDGVVLGEGYSAIPLSSGRSEDVYTSVARRQDRVQNVDSSLGYEKHSYRQQSQVTEGHPVTSGVPGGESRAGRHHGQDNPAFVADEGSHTPGEMYARNPPSASLDLRSAWQRLYGNSLDPGAASRRPSIDDALSSGKARTPEDAPKLQGSRQQNGHLPSPLLTQTRSHPPHIARSNSHEPTHNLPSSSSQNGRFTPHNPTSPAVHPGSLSPHHMTTVRESPTGQSSSNPDPTSGSNNSSQLSAYSASTKAFSTFKPHKNSNRGSDPAIGPSSKYPDTQLSTRVSSPASHQAGIHTRNRTLSEDKRAESRQSLSSPHFTSKPASPSRQNSSTSEAVGFGIKEDLTRPPSRFSSAFLDSDESFEEEYSLQPLDSIFDYHEGGSEDGTVTPRPSSHVSPRTSSHVSPRTSSHAAPLTFSHGPGVTPRRSDNSTPGAVTTAVPHRRSPGFVPKTPDLLRKSPETKTHPQNPNNTGSATIHEAERRLKTRLGRPSKEDQRPVDGHDFNKARSRSLDDVRESENDSLVSFDVENTILTVEPSDQSDRGTIRSHKGSNSVRAQLSRLEGMYSHVIKTLEESSRGTRARRRWSIGSSDTSSMRHHTHQTWHSRQSGHRLAGRDVKAIGKRFQRLESHVITLARSVAHLSSELRVQNSLSREMENVKREIQELKSQSSACPVIPGNLVRPNRLLTDFERSQGWVPSLTDPRRVNKLTKFFGQEPPLLEIFLKQLGYEKFLKNFEQEHIGMIELPYMTEDKLQAVGIPLGPRLRILQEAQVYFKQANLDVYFV
ncbi:hypothetical protein BsWGS_15232 [Bradybaena similaris]